MAKIKTEIAISMSVNPRVRCIWDFTLSRAIHKALAGAAHHAKAQFAAKKTQPRDSDDNAGVLTSRW